MARGGRIAQRVTRCRIWALRREVPANELIPVSKIKLSLIICSIVLGSAFAGEKEAAHRTLAPDSLKQLMEEMVWVEGGWFSMGSDSVQASGAEGPAHEVTLDGFYIGKYELSQALFVEVMGWNWSYFQGEGRPVNNISWLNIQLFMDRLNEMTGKRFRLPTEAEWEYAAKGGQRSKGYRYSGSNNIDEVAWYAENSERRVHSSGLKKPNELGLYDMTGNLWEFCHDEAYMRPYRKESKVNPVEGGFDKPYSDVAKITRGGGYEFDADECLVFRRDGATPNVRMPDIGFRLVLVERESAERSDSVSQE